MKGIGNTIKLLIIGIIMAALVIMFYYHVSEKKEQAVAQKTEETGKLSTIQSLTLRNLENDYPPSPKEVIKYYSDITMCYYNETYTDEELERLAYKSMELMDDDLVAHQDKEQYLVDLKSEIANMKSQDCKIFSYTPSASTDVVYFTKDGRDCASIYCTYALRLQSSMGSTRELFILRKDEAGHWKILGWDVVDEKEE